MDFDPNTLIWKHSQLLSKPYWDLYEQLIGQQTTVDCEQSSVKDEDCAIVTSQDTEPDLLDDLEDASDADKSSAEEEVNAEYLEFIRITREHQAERDRLKQLELEKKASTEVEEYYIDISQVNTFVEDNLVKAPVDRNEDGILSKSKLREDKLIGLYGSREAYEKIRSMEMNIDEYFSRKHQELTPSYWPVMPLNPKPYLNTLS